jgi:hypothetical protein
MWDNRKTLFAKTALMINAEHPSTIQTTVRPRYYQTNDNAVVWSNTYMPQQWYAGGPSRRTLETIAVNAFRKFGASVYSIRVRGAGRRRAPYRGVPGSPSEFYHYFHDQRRPTRCRGPASRRPHAPTQDHRQVNKLALSDLQRPEVP